MELPADFQERVGALRHPDTFLRQVLALLAEREQADAQAPAFAACRTAWQALDPDLAHRYAAAIGTPWAMMMSRLRPPPAEPGRPPGRNHIGPVPAWSPHRDVDTGAVRAEHHRQIRQRHAAAGLPLLPDLFLPEDRP
ncbi:hypothetical protein [Actinoplanes derwentensis]|uniref:Uncharacterized protein n=1 Tax=Actinoplanes derwentensis TaxID=113562 RepID=A0A1H2DCJ4_9ACTN|nr:hypothetical protein [Actinoplanes derwentensis]GID90411.1 hypothetical protein Ade03nite_93350 [Actinoplanes derwentensis]SDT80463.1 hypothetical protein SAMN04489716_9214 [Actinoplanes derwentensis]